jgi:hypothetical protein
MRRVFICLFAVAVILLGSVAVASARPVVDFGTQKVGACQTGTSGLRGCTVRRIWFSNHTDTVVRFVAIELDGGSFHLTDNPFSDSTCSEWFYIPAHGVCNVKVIGDAQQVGPNSGLLSLLGRDQTLRKARLLITGVN